MLKGYSRDVSESYARLERDDSWKGPEPKEQRPRKEKTKNADKEVPAKKKQRTPDKEVPKPEALDEQLLETKDLCERPEETPEKEDATIPEPEALDEQCGIALRPMLQSMVQNGANEEDNTWGNWTAQGKLQQAPSQAPTTCLRRAESDSQERSNRIAKRIQILLKRNYKCFSQARCQAESTIVSQKWLTKSELNKIKAECRDECCNPAPSEAATEHSEIRRLLNLADENPHNSEAATGHSKIPEAACLESKRPKKSGKGT